MDKTILIPTDFSIESLSLLKVALAGSNEKQNILLVHGYTTPDSITEMLFFSPSKVISQLQTAEFKEACSVIRSRYGSSIGSFKIKLFTGKTLPAFETLLEQNQVETVVVPSRTLYRSGSSASFDLLPFLHKCSADKLLTGWEARAITSGHDSLEALFAR